MSIGAVEMIGLVLTIGGAIFGAVRYVDSMVQRHLEPVVEELKVNTKETTAIRVALFGVDYNNGIRSQVRTLQEDVKGLRERVLKLAADD